MQSFVGTETILPLPITSLKRTKCYSGQLIKSRIEQEKLRQYLFHELLGLSHIVVDDLVIQIEETDSNDGEHEIDTVSNSDLEKSSSFL